LRALARKRSSLVDELVVLELVVVLVLVLLVFLGFGIYRVGGFID